MIPTRALSRSRLLFAYRLRFDDAGIQVHFKSFLQSLPVVLGVQTVIFFVVGVYRGVWRMFGLMDAVVVAEGSLRGQVLIELALLYLFRFEHYSRGVFIIYAALLMLVMTGSRASFRLISEFIRRRRESGQRLLIYGAGDAGAIAVRQLIGSSTSTRTACSASSTTIPRNGDRECRATPCSAVTAE